MKETIILLALLLSVSTSYADPSPHRTYTHPNSECSVESTSGEYPRFITMRNGKVIYMPESDGIIKVLFSPNGQFIAFSGSEISGVDIQPGVFDYSVVILECNSGSLKGFTEGFPEPDMQWNSDRSLSYTDSATEKRIEIKF